ncbi:hypothetical protein [Halobacillus sp. Marseille-Q1614]|uniref:hypothetical protein n=1 Tax=Halobacillus sp. Marseille-Q1614 TaxID=2709134 RepID=UPI00156ECD6B|nr:hypothetical protein [Halobacillus sp. Marseille-Q1614]
MTQDKGNKKNNQFKENKNHGEHHNGRLSQMKNHNSTGGEDLNEFINNKDNE